MDYRSFMMDMLRNLEPRQLQANQILFKELDDINEILFVQKGTVDIGYQVNDKKYFVLRCKDKTLIGAYNCTFNIRIIFTYKA